MNANLMTVKQAAEKWGCEGARVRQMLGAGLIRGAVKFGAAWAIPASAKRPKLALGRPKMKK